MTTTTSNPAAVGQEIVLFSRLARNDSPSPQPQLRDTVAAYLARGERMPTPTDVTAATPTHHYT